MKPSTFEPSPNDDAERDAASDGAMGRAGGEAAEPLGDLFVLDGTAALFRAYFAKDSIVDSGGREVAGVIGFCQYLRRCIRALKPRHMVVVFDARAKTFRHERYPDYKANRPSLPEDLPHQFDLAHASAEIMGFKTFRMPGFEADDLMATLAERATRASLRTSLISTDKDILQLVTDSVRVLDPKEFYPVDGVKVRRKFGVSPGKLRDYLALAGDASDNVPGVRGVGPKAAAVLLTAFDCMDGIYANLKHVDELPVRGARAIRKRLEEGRDDAFLSRELVELKRDVPLEEPLTFGDLRYRGPQLDARARFRDMGMPLPVDGLPEPGVPELPEVTWW